MSTYRRYPWPMWMTILNASVLTGGCHEQLRNPAPPFVCSFGMRKYGDGTNLSLHRLFTVPALQGTTQRPSARRGRTSDGCLTPNLTRRLRDYDPRQSSPYVRSTQYAELRS